MNIKTILKIVGAGITASFVALKIRGPRKSYSQFLRTYEALTIDFMNQLEGVFLQTFLASSDQIDKAEVEALLDRPATFHEKLRFFQTHLAEFADLAIRAVRRLYKLRHDGFVTGIARSKVSQEDTEMLTVALDELFLEFETSFFEAMLVNVPEAERLEFEDSFDKDRPLPEVLADFHARYRSSGAVLFDALTRFQSKLEPE